MPRTSPSEWAALFNFLGGGLVHMELFPVATTCTCYTEVLVADMDFIWAGEDLIYIIIPL